MRIRGAGKAILKGGLWTGKAALAGGTMGLGGIMAAGSAAAALNAHTAEQAGMARSYGVSTNTFRAWDGIGKQMGLNGENLGDLAEELANKVGEIKSLGEQNSVTDAFKMMGLNLSDVKGKSNEDQMATVLNRALKIKDDQVARSAVDMLMGEEANKILAWMKLSGKTYEQLMAAQSVLGTLAGELAPSITKHADDFSRDEVALKKRLLTEEVRARDEQIAKVRDITPVPRQSFPRSAGSTRRTSGEIATTATEQQSEHHRADTTGCGCTADWSRSGGESL